MTGMFTHGSVTAARVSHGTLVTNNACLLWCHLGMRQDVDGRATKASDSGSSACCPRAVYFLLILFNTKELQSVVTPTNSERVFFMHVPPTYLIDTANRITDSTRTLGRVGKPIEVQRFRLMSMPRGGKRFRIGSGNPLNQTQLLWIYGTVSVRHAPSARIPFSAYLRICFVFFLPIFLVFTYSLFVYFCVMQLNRGL